MTQLRFATLDHRNKKTQTGRQQILSEIDPVAPWSTLLRLVEPYHPEADRIGRSGRLTPLRFVLQLTGSI
jgi:hypothetical protein